MTDSTDDVDWYDGPDDEENGSASCPFCGGAGVMVGDDECEHCGGTGRLMIWPESEIER